MTDDSIVLAAWHCDACDVRGRDPEETPVCWACGGEVVIDARPVVSCAPSGKILKASGDF